MNNSIPDSELILLKAIWKAKKQVSANEIISSLPSDVSWQRTTILTLLSRMVEKNIIAIDKSGKVYTYYSLIDEDEYKISETKAFVQKIHGNEMNSFVAALCSDDVFSVEEMRQLKELLNKA